MASDGARAASEARPFVGRAAELAAGERGLVHRRGVLVFGAGGTGKTRLAQQLIDHEGGRGWHRVAGAPGAGEVAFAPWAHLLPPGAGALQEVATWRALADHLRGPDGSIRLFVDDAQWLDPSSIALMHHLVVTGGASAIVTSRRDQPPLPPLTALWKDGHLERVDLQPLTVDEADAVVEAALGAPVEPTTIARFHSRTGGNLLLVHELVDDARQAGTLQLLHGAWIETAPTQPSPRLVDLLADRVVELAPELRAGAEVLAVAAPIEQQVLSRIVPAQVVGELAAQGLVEVSHDQLRPTVALADPIMAEVLVGQLGPGRRHHLLARVVDQLEQEADPTEDDQLRLATWQVELGRVTDPDAIVAAADLASARSDFATAEALAVAAADAGAGPAATIRVGEALARQQRHAEADEVLEPLASQLRSLDEGLRFRYAEARAFALGRDLGRLDEAIAVLEATIATMADDRSRWALEAHLAFLLADCGRLAAAAPLAEARLANVADDEPSALTAFVAGGLIRTYAGRCEDTLALCEQMLPIALRHTEDRPEAIAWIGAAQMLAHYVRGDFDAARDLIDLMQALVADDPDPTIHAGLLMSHGLLLAERGQLDGALRLLRQSAALHAVDNRRGYQAWCFAITSRVHAMRGDLDGARDALAAARRHLWPGGQAFAGDLDVAEVWVAMLDGDRAHATEVLDAGVARAEREGMAVRALRLRHEAIRAGLPVTPHVEAFATTRVSEQSRWARAEAAHVAALAAEDGAALVAAADDLAELGLHLEAAEAYAQGASALRRAGSGALASRAKQLGEAQRSRCESAATPALRFGELVVGLTGRELDVATRAAAGQPNQEIAEALGISVRTAETHLQRAFAKLGVHRRGDLAAVLGP